MYAYAVISIVEGEGKTKTDHYPLLGISRNEQEANDHFDLILDDRKTKEHYETYWDLKCGTDEQGRRKETRRAMITYREPFPIRKTYTETLIIERWKLDY
jgi:hypothetical protein